MKIVKVHRRDKDVLIGIPKSMIHIFNDIQYAKCTVDETGIHYSPMKE